MRRGKRSRGKQMVRYLFVLGLVLIAYFIFAGPTTSSTKGNEMGEIVLSEPLNAAFLWRAKYVEQEINDKWFAEIILPEYRYQKDVFKRQEILSQKKDFIDRKVRELREVDVFVAKNYVNYLIGHYDFDRNGFEVSRIPPSPLLARIDYANYCVQIIFNGGESYLHKANNERDARLLEKLVSGHVAIISEVKFKVQRASLNQGERVLVVIADIEQVKLEIKNGDESYVIEF